MKMLIKLSGEDSTFIWRGPDFRAIKFNFEGPEKVIMIEIVKAYEVQWNIVSKGAMND